MSLFRLCMRVDAITPVHGFFVANILDYFGGDVRRESGGVLL